MSARVTATGNDVIRCPPYRVVSGTRQFPEVPRPDFPYAEGKNRFLRTSTTIPSLFPTYFILPSVAETSRHSLIISSLVLDPEPTQTTMEVLHRPMVPAALYVLLHLCASSLAFPTLTERNSDSYNGFESAILSALKSRTRREAAPAPEVQQPETAAHYADLISRSYGSIVPIPKLLIPTYFGYRPRVYISVPQDYYSNYPKSDLFRMKPVNDLLPIFKKETPTSKVDPVPASQLPVQPPGNFPFWNQQSSNWVWPDGISTGSLPSALFGLQNKTQKSVDMAALPAVRTGLDATPVV
ncbi:hypothetical protein RRG08_010138 [Elysia crispata]|uniref:Uncharacterized protein n=1 Tax=Elysia crispata TaxID=231223 RepID=A0AAE1DI41_9GAST|nr:hypothetical protein RRG08_010138 [Elysia crispata]